MRYILQKDLTNVQFGSPSKLLDKEKDGATKEACSTRENLIYYAFRTNHSLRG